MPLMEELKEEIKIENEHAHRLFVKENPSKTFHLFISDFISCEHEIDEIVNKMSQATGEDELIIDISSPGGYTIDLMRIENVCREYFYNRVTTKMNPYGYSCGGLVFLFGDTRIIFENSEAMFHDISTGTFGKRSDIDASIKHSKKYWDAYLRRTLCPFFTAKEINSLFKGEEIWMGALEMCERGIATDVCIFGKVVPAVWYIEYCKNPKTRKDIIKKLYKNRENLSRKDEDFLTFEHSNLKSK